MKGLTPIELLQAPMNSMPVPTPSETNDEGPPKEELHAEFSVQSETAYFPLLETLRLYAGWLLAWYAAVYAIGSYQFMKDLPFHVPYAESLFLSPLVLSFTFAAYLFLLTTSLYKRAEKKKIAGVGLLVLSVAVFVLYRMNVQ